MTEDLPSNFQLRFAGLPQSVRETLVLIARSSQDARVTVEQHGELLRTSIAVVDADFGEAVRIEMGWCLERMDDPATVEWVAAQRR